MLDVSTTAALVAVVEDYRATSGAGPLAVGHDRALLHRWCDHAVHWDTPTGAGPRALIGDTHDELAGRSAAHGIGPTTGLLEAVGVDVGDGRARLLASVRSPRAVAFLRPGQGWAQATLSSSDHWASSFSICSIRLACRPAAAL